MTVHDQDKGFNMIYLLRHGEIEDSDNRRYVGQADCALSDIGRAQAGQWKKWLERKSIETIFCSDLVRSYETAEIIADGRDVGVQVEPSLREINLGEWDGRSMQAVRAELPLAWEERGRCIDTFRPPKGESFVDLYRRVVPVFEQIVKTAQGPVLIVGHAGVNRMILIRVLGMPLRNLFAIRQDFGALNLIDDGRQALQVAAINITPGNIDQRR